MKWLKGRFHYAFQGLAYALMKDKSIQLQVVFACMAIFAAYILKCDRFEWLWILLSIALVISHEIFNSCIELTIDYISLERNKEAKRIKDLAAAAVFFTSLFALAVALIILLPKVWRIVNGI